MMEALSKTIKRIKREHPTKSVYYVRVSTSSRQEPNWKGLGKDEGKDFSTSAAKVDPKSSGDKVDYRPQEKVRESVLVVILLMVTVLTLLMTVVVHAAV